MASYVTPKKNSPYIFYVFLVSQANTKLFQVNPTLVAGDVMISIDDGAYNNLTTLPVVSPAGSETVKVALTAAEMNGDNIVVRFKDQAGAEWCDSGHNIQTTVNQIDDLAMAGIGSVQFSYTVTNTVTLLPIEGVHVIVTTDALGANIIASGITDSFGVVVFWLDPGTYYFWRSKGGFSFINPDVEVV